MGLNWKQILLLYTVFSFIVLFSSTPLNFPALILSYEATEEYPFENATHIQYSPNNEIILKPSVALHISLVKDPDGYTFSGVPYKSVDNTIVFDINDKEGKLRSYFFNLTVSGVNQISVSDTQIYPSISFKMPLGPNSTSLTVQKVNQFFSVYTIEPETNGTRYYATTNQPLIINGSSYDSPSVVLSEFNDGTGFFSILSK